MNISTLQTQTPINSEKPINAELKKAADSVESFFMYQMLELTQPKQDEDNPFSGGHAETLYRSNMNEIMADKVTQAGSTGISTAIYTQLLQQQENGL